MRAGIAIVAILVLSGLARMRTWEWQTDLDLWSAAVERGPAMPRSRLCLGLAYVDQQDWIAAGAAFKECRQLAAQQSNAGLLVRAWNNTGSTFFQQGNLDGAEAAYERALGLQPDFTDAQVNQASVMMERARVARDRSMLISAAAAYRRVVESQPTHILAWRNLHMAAIALKDTAGAVEAEKQIAYLGGRR